MAWLGCQFQTWLDNFWFNCWPFLFSRRVQVNIFNPINKWIGPSLLIYLPNRHDLTTLWPTNLNCYYHFGFTLFNSWVVFSIIHPIIKWICLFKKKDLVQFWMLNYTHRLNSGCKWVRSSEMKPYFIQILFVFGKMI